MLKKYSLRIEMIDAFFAALALLIAKDLPEPDGSNI